MIKGAQEEDATDRGTLVFIPTEIAEKIKGRKQKYESFRACVSRILEAYADNILVDGKMLRMEMEAEFGRTMMRLQDVGIPVKAFKPSAGKQNDEQRKTA